MKKLYRVEMVVMVLAEAPSEAAEIAVFEVEADNATAYVATSVPSEWWDISPYGADDDDRTCAEILRWQREKPVLF